MKHAIVVAGAVWFALLTGGAWADTSPVYSQALVNLQAADNLLQAPDAGAVIVDQHACDTEVRHAIRELSHHGQPSAETSAYAPTPGLGLRTTRLHEIRRLLSGALQDVQRADKTDSGLRSLAVSRLTKAIRYINQAMTDSGVQP